MLEILVYYVLPNVLLFGGLYAIARYVENATWYFIENYDEIQEQIATLRSKYKR